MRDLDGRSYLVTGGNTGIGRATVAGLAGRGAQVYLACRSAEKGRAAAAEITTATGNPAIRVLPLDLARLDSVRSCAAAVRELGQPLHGLINNAGLPGRRGRQTADGFELAFGVDHLGHFALTTALLDCLTAGAPARVVTVSSGAHFQAPGIDFGALQRPGRSITGLPEYAVAKLCNVLFSQELARRLTGTRVTTYVLHPGVVASDIWRRVPWPARPLLTRRMLSTEQGARTSLFCATDPAVAAASGRYYENCGERPPSPVATPELAAELWQRSEEWTAH